MFKLPYYSPTFRMGRVGDPIVSNGIEAVCNILQRLLFMVPGMDDYNTNMGLDITTRAKRSYIDNTRDTEYESMIVEQMNTYTDIIPTNVVAIFKDSMLIISITGKLSGNEFMFQTSSDPDTFAAQIQPKVVGYHVPPETRY